jgi:hypothetical protein
MTQNINWNPLCEEISRQISVLSQRNVRKLKTEEFRRKSILNVQRDFWTKVRSLWVFLGKFRVTDVKLVVELEKKNILVIEPSNASFRPFSGRVRGFFHDFSDLSPKYENWRHFMLTFRARVFPQMLLFTEIQKKKIPLFTRSSNG